MIMFLVLAAIFQIQFDIKIGVDIIESGIVLQ